MITLYAMNDNTLLFSIFLIFSGAAVLSTLALYTRQSLLVAYMVLGIVLGPWGLKLVVDAESVQKIGDVGIIFLLFLLGLHLQPQSLFHVLRKVTWVAVISSAVFMIIGFVIAYLFSFSAMESLIIGATAMFSSTIIGLKLLPTTVLHHQHTGEVMIGVLLLQDLIAIIVLLLVSGASVGNLNLLKVVLIVLSLPILLVLAFLIERYVLMKLFAKFDRIREYMFLVAIAWCLTLSAVADLLHLSAEIGAFIAGISLATSPISLYIAESLKPVRDFFLVLFFFSIGASFDLHFFTIIALPACLLALVLLLVKPFLFSVLLRQVGEAKHVAWEIGIRLGQVSEFSLLVAYVAGQGALIGEAAANLVQVVTMITFIASSYIVVMRYPTPVALSEKLRRD